ncbi:winged helix-turn-helix transcriptional regulator [Niabella terrae]
MNAEQDLYRGCPIQYARQFIAGKWQMGILWNLRNSPLRFSEISSMLPGIPDKVLAEELDFFVEKQVVVKRTVDIPNVRTDYSLSSLGETLIPVINTILIWGYNHLQDEKVIAQMTDTPTTAIRSIETLIRQTH